jgi:hypothetical protein
MHQVIDAAGMRMLCPHGLDQRAGAPADALRVGRTDLILSGQFGHAGRFVATVIRSDARAQHARFNAHDA